LISVDIDDQKKSLGMSARLYLTNMFIGKIEEEKRQGEGTMFFASGSKKFVGVWEDDVKTGFGKEYFEEGQVMYEGGWSGG
jgi:hypothetical protein